MKGLSLHTHYIIAFWITLFVALCLLIGGFFTPPMGQIDGSVLTASGILFLWPTLAFGTKALEESKKVHIHHKDTDITIGDED